MAKATERKSLEDIIKDLNKSYGKGSVISGKDVRSDVETVSTGSVDLDLKTGIGGIPLNGKIIDLWGQESSGKSTLAQSIIGNYQKLSRKRALYVDGENSLDPDYAKALGINLEDLLIVQLDSSGGEGAYDKAERLIKSGEIGLCVFDSYNSLQPKKVMEGEYGAANIGLHARLMGLSLVKNNSLAMQYGTTFLYLGQVRTNVGQMFGNPEIPQGGAALKFYSHMRLKISRSTTDANSVMDGDEKIGNLVNVDVIKNKLGSPFKRASFNIIYGEGIDNNEEIMRLGNEYEIFKKWGTSITFEDTKYEIKEFHSLLVDNPEFKQQLKEKLKDKYDGTKDQILETESISSDTEDTD